MGVQLVEYQVLPQGAAVGRPEGIPAAVIAHEAGVEPVDLGGRDDLGRPPTREGADGMHDEGGLEDGHVVGDRRAAHLAGPGEGGGLEDAPALGQEELDQPLKRVAPFEPEQLENVLGPVGVQPFLKIALGKLAGQEEGRQPAPQEAMVEVAAAEVRQVGEGHRGKPHLGLPAGQRVPKAGRGAEG